MSFKVRESSVLESIGNTTDGLLADARDHLRDGDEGTLRATDSHSETTVGFVEFFEEGIVRRLLYLWSSLRQASPAWSQITDSSLRTTASKVCSG